MTPASSRDGIRNPALWVLAVLIVAATVLQLHYRTHLDFMADDWRFMFGRTGGGLSDYVNPYFEHCVVVLVGIYRLFFAVFGFGSAMPLHVLSTGIYMASVLALFIYLRNLVGDAASVIGCAVVLFLGAAFQDILWPFQMGYSIPIALGLATLLLIKREDRRSDVAASALITVAMFTTSMAIPFLVGAVIQYLVLRRDPKRGLLLLLPPVLLYAAWWIGWGHTADSHIYLTSVLHTPEYVVNSFQYSVGVLTGTFRIEGTAGTVLRSLLGVLLIAICAIHIRRRRSVPPALLVGLGVAITFWVFSGVGQIPDWGGREFNTPRYQYPNAIFLMMILAGAFQGVRPDRKVLAGIGVVAAITIVVNLGALSDGYQRMKTISDYQHSGFTAVEIAGANVSPDFEFAQDPYGFYTTKASDYFRATDRYGSIAWSPEELAAAPDDARQVVDITLVSAEPIAFEGASRPAGSDCRKITATPDGGGRGIDVPPGPFTVQSDQKVTMTMGRFSDSLHLPYWPLPAGRIMAFDIPKDSSDVTWRIGAQGAGKVTICSSTP